MADFSQYAVNLDTPQPGGRQGESPRSAFTKYNDLLGALEGELEGITYEHISATAPVETYPFQPWVDTSVNPPMLRRRNAGDDAWVAVMPVLVPLGTASQRDMPPGVDELGTIIGLDVPPGVDEVYHRLNAVGTVSQSGGVPTGALVQYGSNANGQFWKYAGGMQVWTYSSSIAGGGWTEAGGKFYSAAFSAPFAAPFAAPPRVTVQPKDGQVGARGAWCPLAQATSTQISTAYFTALQTHTSEVLFDAIGIGRWHA